MASIFLSFVRIILYYIFIECDFRRLFYYNLLYYIIIIVINNNSIGLVQKGVIYRACKI